MEQVKEKRLKCRPYLNASYVIDLISREEFIDTKKLR